MFRRSKRWRAKVLGATRLAKMLHLTSNGRSAECRNAAQSHLDRQLWAALADGKPATGILGVAAAPRVGSEPFLTNAAERLDGRFGGPAA